jgi:ABC-2 type transport system ATP-binding protein
VVFQTQSLDKALTVGENLRGQGHLHGLSGSTLERRMEHVMERLSLKDRRGDLVETLSGGLKRRVEIAKGLLHRPLVLLMDEASTGLDPRARRELWQYVEELRDREGVTILLTTHILDEADRCDRLVLLHQGQIVAEGSPAQLRSRIGGDVVVLETSDTALGEKIEAKFGVRASLMEGMLRVEIANGHRFITEAVEAFPGAIESVRLQKPTLEDVFVHETGAMIE